MVFGVNWRKTGKKKEGENIPNPEMPVEYERKNIPYDFTEDCIAVMKIYEKVSRRKGWRSMDVRQQIKKFDEENKPFYLVDHENGVYSLCLPLSFLGAEYKDFGQEAFNQYAIRAGESVMDGRFYTHGDGYEWQSVFEKAFEGEENLKQIIFDCEAGGFFCYSRDFEILAEYGRRFCEMCMKEQEFTELVCSALSEDRQPVEEEISTEGMTPFFTAVAELARRKGFKIKGVQGGALTLTLNGEFAVMVDESGAINYHPYDEVFDIMDEVSELRKSIPLEETGQGMQMNV